MRKVTLLLKKCCYKCPYYGSKSLFVGSHYVDYTYCDKYLEEIRDTVNGFPTFCKLEETRS